MRMMKCQRCGVEIEWKSRRKYCLPCADIVNKEKHKEYIKKNGRTPKKHYLKKIKCKCPKMRKNTHGGNEVDRQRNATHILL